MSELLHTGVIRSVLQFPKKIGIVEGEKYFTYREIGQMSILLSEVISLYEIPAAFQEELIAAVYLDKAWLQIIAVLGILFSRYAYLPIDAEFPLERVESLLSLSGAKVIVTQRKYIGFLEHLKISHCIIDIETVIYQKKYDQQQIKIMLERIQRSHQASSLAYIIYTSGTTGTPKGVAVTHASAMNTICDINERFDVNKKDSILSLSRLNFDLSVYDIFGLLAVGGKIVVPQRNEQFEPREWIKLIAKEKITLWNSVPAFAQMLAEIDSQKLPNFLRLFLLSGDWVSIKLVQRLKSKTQEFSKIVSLGGATEASIWSILYEINHIDPIWKSIPYGYAMRHQTVEVLNNNLHPCKMNEPGEIYIGGMGLAREYFKDVQKTQESFIFHPTTQKRLYKTGDRGKYIDETNLIEFLGREDAQIKLNGYRIELTEIEHFLNAYQGIKRSCVIEHQHKIYAFCETGGSSISLEECQQYILSKLPLYMVPNKYYLLDKLPVTVNGKIDKAILSEKYLQRRRILKGEGDKQSYLYLIWQEVLSYSPASPDDDFFDVGGDSLKAVILISKVNAYYHLELLISAIYQAKTLSKLESLIKINRKGKKANHSIVNFSFNYRQPFFLFHPISGQIFCYTALSKLLANRFDVYAIEATPYSQTIPKAFQNKTKREYMTIPMLAKQYVEMIRELQPNGPYYFAGWSVGGLIAYESALAMGEDKVKFLGMFDTYPPIDALLTASRQFSSSKLVETILHYYYQELTKVIPSRPGNAVDFEELCKRDPKKSIDFIFNLLISQAQESPILIAFATTFTQQFKNILDAMMHYKPSGKSNVDIVFIKAASTSSKLVSLWQNHVNNPIIFEQVDADHINFLESKYIQNLYSILNRYI